MSDLEENIKGKALHDTYLDKKGKRKNRPWNDKKRKNEWYSKMLYEAGMDDIMTYQVLDNIEHCGEHLEFYQMPDNSLKLNQAFFCKNRLCPMCMWRLSLKRGAVNKKIISHIVKGYPNAHILMLTLTVPNVKGKDLGKTVSNLSKSFNKMIKYVKVKKNLIGFMRKFEYTVKRKRVDKYDFSDENFDVIEDLEPNELEGNAYAVQYHPHLHVMLVMKSTYFNRDSYIEQKEWKSFWERACKNWLPDTSLMVDIRKVNKKKKKELERMKNDFSQSEYKNESDNALDESVQGAVNEMSKGIIDDDALGYLGKGNDWMASSPYEYVNESEESNEDEDLNDSEDDVMTSYDQAMKQKNNMVFKMREFNVYDPDVGCDMVVMRVLNKELHGKRTIGYGGELREYYRTLKVNEDDLVHTDEENEKEGTPKHKVCATWKNNFYKITRDEVISAEQDKKEREDFIEFMKDNYHYKGKHDLQELNTTDTFYTKIQKKYESDTFKKIHEKIKNNS